MQYKKISLILFTIGLVMITSGSVASFVLSLQSDQKQIRERMESVSLSYENFNTYVTKFQEMRETINEKTLKNLYYDTFKQEDKLIKTQLSNYENIVDTVKKSVSNMDSLCKNVYYPDSDTNHKCSKYKSIYEQVINYFLEDISIYNSNVEVYNNYQQSLGNNDKIEKYKTAKKYIDYNHDGQYEGKEE